MNYGVVLITTKDKAQARKITNALLKRKLAACVNIIAGIESHFIWEGKVDKAAEVLMVIKTKKNCFQELSKTVKSLHSYSTPEIIFIPIALGEKNYLNWINTSTLSKDRS